MLPDYLVDGYDLVSSFSELKEEFIDDELDGLCYHLGTSSGDIESVDWYRYVWNKRYISYPENKSVSDSNVFVVLYEELEDDNTIEAVIGLNDKSDTVVKVFGPTNDMNPLEISGFSRDDNKLYRDMRIFLNSSSR